MNTNALFKIGYGLYVLSCNEQGKDNGCIVNSIMQITIAKIVIWAVVRVAVIVITYLQKNLYMLFYHKEI